jgi:4'-phosphopantetheinyl transferase EntD
MTLALAGLFDADIRVAQGDPRVEWDELLPGETAAIARASPARRREFAAGRALARRAIAALDLTAAAIPAADDRAPVWPSGIRGSISHCADWCVAAAARADDGYLAIGVDIEPAEPLDADLIEEICTTEERRRLDDLPAERRDLLARMIFCAKECAYKCQYPLSGQLLDFQALSIRLEQFQQECVAVLRPESRKNKELEHFRDSRRSGNALDEAASAFTARFEVDAAPFRKGDELAGRITLCGGYVVAGMALREQVARPS